MKYRLLAGGLALALAVPAPACGSTGAAPTEVHELRVWLMRDTATPDFIKRFKEDFEREHPQARLTFQIQEWDGVTTKVAGALVSIDPPDVIEVGNTQVAQYAASSGVTDLSGKVDELGGADWIPGLRDPGAIDGKQYGIPFYAANRVVIYRTDMFAAAGIEKPPTSRDEWLAVTEKLNRNGVQGIYLPGQNWYVLAGFIWDEGGDLARRDGARWVGTLGTPESLAGMDFYRQLQALGAGPKDSDEAKPQQVDVVASEQVAQFIAPPGTAALVLKANPSLAGKLGFFSIPGKKPGTLGSVFTGGSDLIIPAASDEKELAYEVVKTLAGERWQIELATTMNYVPNRASLHPWVSPDAGTAAMAASAAYGRATPNSPRWTAVEANNPIKTFMTSVLTGADPNAAAAEADSVITTALNPDT